VPQGWGSRGVEGKLKAVEFAREKKIPYLGLCFGMQMAVIEYSRNILGLDEANSTEVNPKTKYPVIHIMPDQKKYLEAHHYGGTIRLGSWPCSVEPGSILEKAYKSYGKEPNKIFNDQFEILNQFKNLNLNEARIKEIIQLQEKLHITYGRNRKKVAIGIYPLEKIKFPIRFLAKSPNLPISVLVYSGSTIELG